tara:strand:+ start:864 stop:1304 length:441 start_codon:yes stop_codon:yes gene_type:complete
MPETQFYCQTANLPGVSISEIPIPTPHKQHYVAGDNVTFDEFSITIIVDEYLKNWEEIQTWIIGLGKPFGFDEYEKRKAAGVDTTGQLFILTGSKNPSLRFDFYNLWPKSIGSVQFDIMAADITYSTADVVFQYNYYTMTRINEPT